MRSQKFKYSRNCPFCAAYMEVLMDALSGKIYFYCRKCHRIYEVKGNEMELKTIQKLRED
ncbi:hypothetical protein DRJ17_04135 [Candidatus Woesearchaeota archaeon]|nr:MAG: hypothetical protein DRJ17_04135 [Candidatus Woesearchaeota archaeon]